MAQLSDDCFAFGGPMMSVDEAVGLIAARVTPVVDVEPVPLARADGRILAHDILAPLPLPPFTNSAVDGYAVASRDLPQQIAGLYHAGSVGIIMSGWLGAVNYGVIVANDVDKRLTIASSS